MKAVTHLEKVIAGEVSAVTHLEKVIAQETTAVTYTEKVIAGTAPPVTHLQKVIAGEARPVTHLEYVWAGGSPPSVQEYTGAVPVTFVADGTPLLDILISGNTVQTGTPTPQNPIQPSECGERTGNLFDKNSDTINNTGQARPGVKVSSGTYSINNTTDRAVYYRIGNEGTATQVNGGRKAENIIASDDLYVWRDNGIRQDGVMLNLGLEALPYEPWGYKIPISSASTTTPVYLGEVETTRKIIKYEFNGSEAWAKNSASATDYIYYLAALEEGLTRIDMICSHLPIATSGISPTIAGVQLFSNLTTLLINVGSNVMDAQTSGNTVAGLKEYLAAQYANGTPVTVWYVLAEPQTAVVNEPLMRIGNYADTLSMGQAGVSIPTANGSTTLDVETTVPPSEIYIKYRGEAAATLSSLPAEVSSPEETPEEVNPEETEETENGSEDVSLQYKPEAIE